MNMTKAVLLIYFFNFRSFTCLCNDAPCQLTRTATADKKLFPLHSQTNGSNFLFLLFFGSAFLAHTISPSSLAPPPFPILLRKSPVLLPPLLSRASQLFKCVMGSGVLITFDQQFEKVNLDNITKVSLLWQGAALMLLILENLQITDQNQEIFLLQHSSGLYTHIHFLSLLAPRPPSSTTKFTLLWDGKLTKTIPWETTAKRGNLRQGTR